jgi:hypothetical protein
MSDEKIGGDFSGKSIVSALVNLLIDNNALLQANLKYIGTILAETRGYDPEQLKAFDQALKEDYHAIHRETVTSLIAEYGEFDINLKPLLKPKLDLGDRNTPV